MQLNRRSFLALGGLASATAAGMSLSGCVKEERGREKTRKKLPSPRGWDGQTRALPIPPLAPAQESGMQRTFTLTTQRGESEILPGIKTPTWGFNGSHLGPTIRASRGDAVSLTVLNELTEETAVHWHGMLLPARADGGPHSPIAPGKKWTASYTVEQPAATLWYHPHPHGETGLQAYRGLAGMIILEDDVSKSLDLPQDYGVDDVPLILMDANFTEAGVLDETIDDTVGLLGDVPYVNGITNPHFQATTRRVRFRILCGSTMRFHNLALSDSRSFHIIASDSGLLESPQEATSVMLGPGERVEIVVDIAPGEEVSLQSIGFADHLGVPQDEYTAKFRLHDAHEVLLIKGPESSAPEPQQLPQVLDTSAGELPNTEHSIERTFVLNTFQINEQSMDMHRVDIAIAHSDPEKWVVTNGNSDWIHNFHIHNCAFKVLSLNGTDAVVTTQGWKDTITLPPGATATLAVVFGQYRDNHYPYMYHCHMLFHEDQGMMGQYMMLNKGEKPDLRTDYTLTHPAGEHRHSH
ncbi:multicopper oxidase family protein [Corynebacterium ulcerans]|uniref:multicopper oxidase family protein n=1 Tax=Corynebacterium ulcerans TaxID=65058 RepID=UPI000C762652|nr:multicopper oxidase domain-containing protein [Corynebacterium ulcerans]PLW02296.1 copper oxidase [Corynebacterium ulcerans]